MAWIVSITDKWVKPWTASFIDHGGSSIPSNAIVTDAGDYIVTDAGDYIVTD